MTGHVLAYLKGKVNIPIMQEYQTTFLKRRKERIFSFLNCSTF